MSWWSQPNTKLKPLDPHSFQPTAASHTQAAITNLAGAVAGLQRADQKAMSKIIYDHLEKLASVHMSQRELDRIFEQAQKELPKSNDKTMHVALAEKEIELAVLRLDLAIWPAQQSERMRLKAASESLSSEMGKFREQRAKEAEDAANKSMCSVT